MEFLIGVISGLVCAEILGLAEWISVKIISWAAQIESESDEQYLELRKEYTAILWDQPIQLMKLVRSIGILQGSRRTRHECEKERKKQSEFGFLYTKHVSLYGMKISLKNVLQICAWVFLLCFAYKRILWLVEDRIEGVLQRLKKVHLCTKGKDSALSKKEIKRLLHALAALLCVIVLEGISHLDSRKGLNA